MDYSLTRFKGDTYPIKAILSMDDEPLDFTPGNNTALFSFAKGTVYRSIPGTFGTDEGEIYFPFPQNVSEGEYIYDIQVTDINGFIRTYVKDKLTISKDITK
jgi:hypothetical protein